MAMLRLLNPFLLIHCPQTAPRLLQKLTTAPGYRQEQVRSAYHNGKQLGGYRVYERLLRVGAVRLLTGCIGGVYTRAEARKLRLVLGSTVAVNEHACYWDSLACSFSIHSALCTTSACLGKTLESRTRWTSSSLSAQQSAKTVSW